MLKYCDFLTIYCVVEQLRRTKTRQLQYKHDPYQHAYSRDTYVRKRRLPYR